MSYAEAKARYAAIGVDTEAAIARLKTVPISLHCWQGDDVRGVMFIAHHFFGDHLRLMFWQHSGLHK